jgi:hypothetical protein
VPTTASQFMQFDTDASSMFPTAASSGSLIST